MSDKMPHSLSEPGPERGERREEYKQLNLLGGDSVSVSVSVSQLNNVLTVQRDSRPPARKLNYFFVLVEFSSQVDIWLRF